MILLFIAGYFFIAMEHTIKVNKASVALLIGTLLWVIYVYLAPSTGDYITENGFGISQKGRDYLLPLIQGEDHPPYKNDLPDYVQLEPQLIAKKLPSFEP